MRKKGRGEIVKVSDLFETYKKRLRAPQGAVIKVFQEIIKDLFSFTIKPDQVAYTVSTRTLSLAVQGPLKSEILLRKKEVLAHLKGRLGEQSSPKEII